MKMILEWMPSNAFWCILINGHESELNSNLQEQKLKNIIFSFLGFLWGFKEQKQKSFCVFNFL